jgi:hypothetical protein
MSPRSSTKTGKILEKSVISTLVEYGCEFVMFSKWIKKPEKYGDELLLKNIPYKTIYGHKGYTEFLLISKKYNLRIRIECKWQQSTGSVDEKFPYLYLSAVEAMPENTIFLLIDGDGFKAGALPWLKDAIKKQKYRKFDKEIRILNLKEFLTWAGDTFRK